MVRAMGDVGEVDPALVAAVALEVVVVEAAAAAAMVGKAKAAVTGKAQAAAEVCALATSGQGGGSGR
jgi:hypothetical protein